MWWDLGLIVIIMGRSEAAMELSCVLNYLSDEDQHGIKIYLADGGENLDIFKDLLVTNHTSWSVIDEHSVNSAPNLGYPGNYMILSYEADSPDEVVRSSIHRLSADMNNWDPSARVIVIVSPIDTTDMHSVASTLISRLWKNMVFDTVIAFVLGNEIMGLFSANPFDEGNECGLKVKKLRILQCGDYHSCGLIWYHPEVYPNCSFRVSRRQTPPFSFNLSQTHFVNAATNEWQGSDIQFVRLLRSKKKLWVTWSQTLSPESGASAKEVHQYYGNFSRYGIDLAIGGNVMTSTYLGKISYLRPHDQHRLLYYVADPDYMRGWPILHTMFTKITWIVLGITISLAGLVYSMVMEEVVIPYKIPRSRFLTVFAILVTQTILQPKRWRPRLLLVTLLLPLYHISSLHLTNLQSFMLHTPLNKGITTEDDLRAANMTVYISDVNQFFIQDKANLQHYVTANDNMDSRLINMNEFRNFSTLARSLEAKFFITINQLRVHQLNSVVTVLPICMAMGKGNVYFDTVDTLVQRCLQMGLFAKWMRDLTLLKRRKPTSAILRTNSTEDGRPALDLIDLECSFLLLFVGYIVATTAFVGEHLLARWQMRNRRKKNDMMVRQKRLEQKFKHYVYQEGALLLK